LTILAVVVSYLFYGHETNNENALCSIDFSRYYMAIFAIFGGHMKRTIKLLALIIVAALALQAFAHDKKLHDKGKAQAAQPAKGEFLGKGDGVKTCPVSGDEITSKDVKGQFFGRTVYFCCADCLALARKNPTAYLKRTQAAQVAATKNLPKGEGHHHNDQGDHHAEHPTQNPAQSPKEGEKQDSKSDEKKFLGKGDGVTTCPVTGEEVNKNLKYEVNGRVFYVCCESCADLVKKNPDLYLKPVEAEKK
jgi:YHS domain-containing protein